MKAVRRYKSEILEISKETLVRVAPDEVDIFDIISPSLFDEMTKQKDSFDLAKSGSGFVADTFSTIIIGIIMVFTNEMIKEGIQFSKALLRYWLLQNEERILEQSENENIKIIIASLKEYLNEK